MSNNAVNSVVANLIRAAAGSSAKNVSDQDVDKYVADLILKEAQEKRTKYDKVGVEAYQPNGLIKKPKPKPNTRFLLNVVKATDSHNQFVIKANEDNVAKLREERLQREREEREKRRSRERRSSREDRRSSKDDSRSSKGDKRSSREHRYFNRERSSRDHKHSSHKSSSSRHDDKKHDRGGTHKNSSDDHSVERQEASNSVQYKGRGKVRINVSSMDKYFSKGYNPLLDVDSDKEEYVGTKRKRKEHRKHKSEKKKKEHKKKKHYSSSSSSSSSSSNEEEEPIKQVRAWDVGKVHTPKY
ncbi:hypothetical protein INT48_004038 [Thamnidium elegans]|uniref:Uncharacterized protein n=1 Tax=Thamnidium elegans TaxID=101142 RepID=A0A8H7VYF3_9FUNG|nr:hypothetical protein INT48_004038 [Thamnidium elegans]